MLVLHLQLVDMLVFFWFFDIKHVGVVIGVLVVRAVSVVIVVRNVIVVIVAIPVIVDAVLCCLWCCLVWFVCV